MLPLFLRLSNNTVHKIHGGQTDVDLSVCNGTTVGVGRDGMTMLVLSSLHNNDLESIQFDSYFCSAHT